MSNPLPIVLFVGRIFGDRQTAHQVISASEGKRYEIYEVETLDAAWTLWETRSPTLAVVDTQLPDGDGLAFVERLLEVQTNLHDDLPVIVLGDRQDAKRAVRALKLGAMDYAFKEELTAFSLITSLNQALSTLRLQAAVDETQQQTDAIQAIGDRLARAADLEEMLDCVANCTRQCLGADRVLIYRWDSQTHQNTLAAESTGTGCLSYRNNPAAIHWQNVCLQKILDQNWQTFSYIAAIDDTETADLNDECRHYFRQLSTRANLVVPIWLDYANKQLIWGFIVCQHGEKPHPWRLAESQFVERIVNNLAIALHQTELYESLQSLNHHVEEHVVDPNDLSLEALERHLMFRLLRDSEQRYATLTSTAPVGIFRTNIRGDCFFFNEEYSRLTTITAAHQAKGIQWVDLLHPDDRELVLTTWGEKLANREIYQQEFRLCHPDGRIHWIYCQMVPEKDSLSVPMGYVGTMTDVTVQKESEAKLKASEMALAEAQRLAHIGSWSFEIKTKTITWSDELFRMFGRDPQGSEPDYAKYLNHYIHPDDRPILENHVAIAITEGKPYVFDYRALLPDGSMRYHEARGQLERDQEGNPFRLFGTAIDITERKTYENELQHLNQTLEAKVKERTQELEDSQEFVKTILDTIPLPVFWKDRNSRMLGCNQKLANLMGLEVSSDFHTPKGSEFTPTEEEIEKYETDDQRVIASGQPLLGLEETFTDAQGNQLMIETNKAPLRDGNGEIIGLVGMFQNVTHRRQTELDNIRLKERLEFLLASSPAVIYSAQFNDQFSTTFISQNVESTLGYSPADFLDPPDFWVSRIHPNDLDCIPNDLDSLLGGGNLTREYRFRHCEGHYVWLRDEFRLVRDQKGNPLEIVGYVADISALKRAEAALWESETRWQFALEGAGDGVWDWDIHNKTVFYSVQWKGMLGYSDSEIPNDFSGWKSLIHPDDKESSVQLIQDYIAGLIPTYQNEHRLRCKDGSYKWILTRGKIVAHTETGEPSRLIGSHTDISDLKLAAQELRVAKEAAELANRAKGEFLALMSHEIRTPMNGVLGLTHLALQTKPHATLQDYLLKIQESGESLLQLINNILDFSKIEANRLDLESAPLNLGRVMTKIDSLLRPKAAEKGVALRFVLDANLPELVLGDELRLSQVMMNLVGNAVKFTDEGQVAIAANVVETKADRITLKIIVEDTGIGIAPDKHHHLFEAFTQADNAISRQYSGTGLGLSICKRLVDLMGGTIEVFSEEGWGSRFTVTLDLALPPHTALTPTVAETVTSQWLGLKCLVVEDVEATRIKLTRFLEVLELRVTATDNAETAIAELQHCPLEDPYELVIMDWHLPGMDGIAASRYLKEMAGLTIIPKILIATAHHRQQLETILDDDEVNGILLKPLSFEQLSTAIAQLFPPRPLGQSPAPPPLRQLAGARILLVEDNAINQQVAAELLRHIGLTVDIVTNGHDAVAAIQQNPYDLVLMDIRMPGMDGYETTRRIRTLQGNTVETGERFMAVPIVAMTAHALVTDQQQCLGAGINAHLGKPIDPQRLYQTLLEWIPPRPTDPADRAIAIEAVPPGEFDFPDIPGLNIPAGLARVAGNGIVYQRLLRQFYATYQTFPDKLPCLLMTQEYDGILEEVHALKGVSSNLGAEDLHQALADFERGIKQADAPAALCQCCHHVKTTLRALLKALAASSLLTTPTLTSLQPPPGVSHSVPDPVAVESLLQQLSDLLDQDLGAAIAVFEQLKQQVNFLEFQPLLVAIETELGNFNLDSVHQHLHNLSSHLERSQTNGKPALR
jgi:PAS domain S-box-containing protein